MTEKRFNIVPSNVVEDGKFIQDNKKEHSFPTTKDASTLVMYEKALNELATKCSQLEKENEQLMKEKEYWKGQCISQSNLNSIYHNELSIAQEQGYAPTDTFKFCFGDLNKHLEKYKKFYNSNSKISERYINAAEDDSTEIYQDTETMEILSDYVILERLNEQEEEIRKLTGEVVRLRLEPQLKQNKKSIKDAVEVNDFLKEQDKTIKELEETIQELYDFRLIYNALLFNEWSKHDTIEVYKSKKHSDGELCFDGEWFVVVAILPTGQITNHYHIKYWDYFQIKEYPQVKDEFDGHTPIDVLNRLKSMVMWNDNPITMVLL